VIRSKGFISQSSRPRISIRHVATARLFQRGPARMAKKLAEEAIEVVIDAVNGNTPAVVRESADLLYNLTVLWARPVSGPRTCGAKWSGASICSELPRSCRNRR